MSANRYQHSGSQPPACAGVLLAAGRSHRFGATLPKQLQLFGGETLVHRAARVLLASRLEPILVVTGYCASEVEGELDRLAVRTVTNETWESGQASSVKTAIDTLPSGLAGALFLPTDQPFVDTPLLDLLLDRFIEGGQEHIVVPTYRGRRGAPVLFPVDLWGELASLDGDQGGRQLLAAHTRRVREVELDSEAPLLDIDTQGDLERLEKR